MNTEQIARAQGSAQLELELEGREAAVLGAQMTPIMCVGGIKQKRDSLVHSLHSAPTCQLGTPVQLRNLLLELVQVALREQCISAGVHIHIYASPPQDRLRPDCPTCPAKGPDCGS